MQRSAGNDDVQVRVVTPELAGAVRALRADPDQYAFVGDVEANLIDTQACPSSEAMAVLAGDAVVGFYRIDLRPGAIAGYDYGDGAAALRSLLIDRDCQGCGVGYRAMLACCADLEHRHRQLRMLALTVNCANRAAIGVYRKAGFIDNGALYFGGRSGPQHLMLRRLGSGGLARGGMGQSAA